MCLRLLFLIFSLLIAFMLRWPDLNWHAEIMSLVSYHYSTPLLKRLPIRRQVVKFREDSKFKFNTKLAFDDGLYVRVRVDVLETSVLIVLANKKDVLFLLAPQSQVVVLAVRVRFTWNGKWHTTNFAHTFLGEYLAVKDCTSVAIVVSSRR